MNARNFPELLLRKELLENRKTQRELAKELNCSIGCIQRYCQKYNIKQKCLQLHNQKFGKLLVIDFHKKDKHGHAIWKCLCDCGKESYVEASNLTHGITKTCGCSRSTVSSKHPNFKGYKEISGTYFASILNGAISREIEFDITIEQIWDLFIEQNRKCALTGLDIGFAKSVSYNRKGYRSASLDRIDSLNGYVTNNIQWVHKDVNRMKMDLSQDRFKEICRLVTIKGINNE